MGDTAWELFSKLTREEATQYLTDRKAKGFTVIQAVALWGANVYGQAPLQNNDPAQLYLKDGPANDYWDHVDYIVNEAERLGLFIGFLPCWGNRWSSQAGKETRIFNSQNAGIYCEWLAKRYSGSPIIWILGGDNGISTDEDRKVIEAMAYGLRKGDGGSHLITFHPRGPGMSSDFLHEAEWLDFNMSQSSHGARDHDNGRFMEHDYDLLPVKPTLDGEPRYERITVGFYNKDRDTTFCFDDYDVRQAAWWAMMAGACGHTYGNNCIWQFWTPGHKGSLWPNAPWTVALNDPGAKQIGYIRSLFEKYDYQKLQPDTDFIVDAPDYGGAKVRGLRAPDGSLAMVYSPRGEPFMLNLGMMKKPKILVSWYNPRTGYLSQLHTPESYAFQTFTPPSSGRENDWVLVLEWISDN
jgi:hypothetical protein